MAIEVLGPQPVPARPWRAPSSALLSLGGSFHFQLSLHFVVLPKRPCVDEPLGGVPVEGSAPLRPGHEFLYAQPIPQWKPPSPATPLQRKRDRRVVVNCLDHTVQFISVSR